MRVPKPIIVCALAASAPLLAPFTPCLAQENRLVTIEASPCFADTQTNEGERSNEKGLAISPAPRYFVFDQALFSERQRPLPLHACPSHAFPHSP
jgi:hypothetical protein